MLFFCVVGSLCRVVVFSFSLLAIITYREIFILCAARRLLLWRLGLGGLLVGVLALVVGVKY